MNKSKKIMLVFGTRPEAIKMAPVIQALKKEKNFRVVVVLTGQHSQMLYQVVDLFKIEPNYDLEIMRPNQTLEGIAIRSLQGLEKVIGKEKPDLLLVQGDTATAFIAALAAFYQKIPVGHIEAGLRTAHKYNPFPEEVNRRLITVVSDLNFAPTQTSAKALAREGVDPKTIFTTGNTVIDALMETSKTKCNLSKYGINLDPSRKLVVVTMHRRENLGQPMKEACLAIKTIAEKYNESVQVVLPVHRNPKVRGVVEKILGGITNVQLVEPLEYLPFVHLLKAANIVLTDSGGVQEEAPSLGKPVLVMRETTERPEAVSAGTVKLIGLKAGSILKELEILLNNKRQYNRMAGAVNPYGDGLASRRIVQAIKKWFGMSKAMPLPFRPKK
jgi:UDP-N-acetylglucosamine 2-epimerase (non-hydrolysing)